MLRKISKNSFFFILMLSFAFVLIKESYAENSINIIKAKGTVNIVEIGGRGLYIRSLWDNNKASSVSSDGSFETKISDSRPQKLWVMDDLQQTRAVAIVLPRKSENIVFDAQSSAIAVLFKDPNLFRSSAEAESLSEVMVTKKSFQDLTVFLGNNLPKASLEELMNNAQYLALLEKCDKEIFKEDQTANIKSLYEAKKELERQFKER